MMLLPSTKRSVLVCETLAGDLFWGRFWPLRLSRESYVVCRTYLIV